MNSGLQPQARAKIDGALDIFRAAFAPVVRDARSLDVASYVRVQAGDNGVLTEADFRDSRRWARRRKSDRAALEDPYLIIKLLTESRPIRVALLSTDDAWLRRLEMLANARNCWAHFDPLSVRRVNRALDSAEQLLRGIGDDDAAQEVAALKRHGPREWPKDAA